MQTLAIVDNKLMIRVALLSLLVFAALSQNSSTSCNNFTARPNSPVNYIATCSGALSCGTENSNVPFNITSNISATSGNTFINITTSGAPAAATLCLTITYPYTNQILFGFYSNFSSFSYISNSTGNLMGNIWIAFPSNFTFIPIQLFSNGTISTFTTALATCFPTSPSGTCENNCNTNAIPVFNQVSFFNVLASPMINPTINCILSGTFTLGAERLIMGAIILMIVLLAL